MAVTPSIPPVGNQGSQVHRSSKCGRAAATNCLNTAEPRPHVRQGGRAATTCACTSHASALPPYWVGSQHLEAFKGLDYARRCQRLILYPSLASILNSDSPEDPPDDYSALDDVNPSPSEEVVLWTLLRALDTSYDSPPEDDDTSERMGLSPNVHHACSSWRLHLLCGCCKRSASANASASSLPLTFR